MKKSILSALLLMALFVLPVRLAYAVENADIVQKLDQILSNQKDILQSLSEVKSELEIVKVRATR